MVPTAYLSSSRTSTNAEAPFSVRAANASAVAPRLVCRTTGSSRLVVVWSAAIITLREVLPLLFSTFDSATGAADFELDLCPPYHPAYQSGLNRFHLDSADSSTDECWIGMCLEWLDHLGAMVVHGSDRATLSGDGMGASSMR